MARECRCRYGFQGFYNKEVKPLVLTKRTVEGIQLQGGTILGTSRGGANIREIVKRLDMWGVDMLFVVGGNGGNAGANAIQEMCAKENVICAVVGIPKSIDNDILLVRPAPSCPLRLLWSPCNPAISCPCLLWHACSGCVGGYPYMGGTAHAGMPLARPCCGESAHPVWSPFGWCVMSAAQHARIDSGRIRALAQQ